MINLSTLHNTYFGIRHGQSKANEAGIIVAGKAARTEYGLTEVGKKQVQDSVSVVKAQGELDDKTIILTSPLTRARETALVAAHVLGIPPEHILTEELLRERLFGKFEGKSHELYKEVIWPADVLGEESNHGIESTKEIVQRLFELIELLEGKYTNKKILFVSHGDTLQIFETAFKNMSSSQHRSLIHMENAEIRKYN